MKATKSIGIYILRGITLLLAVAVFSFFLAQISPVDPVRQYIQANPGVSAENVEAMKEYWGLNDPPVERFFKWFSAVLHGDWGYSTTFRQPVLQVIGVRFRTSLALMATAWVFSGVLGFAIGCVMGLFRDSILDRMVFDPHVLDRSGIPCSVFCDSGLVSLWFGGSCGCSCGCGYTGPTYTPPDSSRVDP